MRAAVFHEFGGDVVIEDLQDPTPAADGIVLEVHANGVCRSDWHGWKGHDASIPLPHVPGHEMAGIVVAAGADVKTVAVGDRVTLPFVLGCGRCVRCREGNEQVCEQQYQPGFTGWGSFAQYVAIPYADTNVVPLPPSMPFTTAAGLGCRFATAFRAVADQGNVSGGTRLAVWGCGGVGLSAVMIASALGADVYAVDIDPSALDLARQVGAHTTLDGSDGRDVAAEIRGLTGGGVDVSIDALGSTTTAIASIRSLRARGRHVQVGLMIGDDAKPVIPMWRLHASEIELFGSHGMQAWRYPDMLSMVADGVLRPGDLVTSTLTLSEGADLLTRMGEFPASGFAVIDDFTR